MITKKKKKKSHRCCFPSGPHLITAQMHEWRQFLRRAARVDAERKRHRLSYHEYFWEHLISLRERKRKTKMARGVWGEDVYVKESVVGWEAEFKGGQPERWMRYLWVNNEKKKDLIHIWAPFLVSLLFYCYFFKRNYSVRWRGNCSVCEIYCHKAEIDNLL